MNKWNLIGAGIMMTSIIVLGLIQISLVKGVTMNPIKYFTQPTIVLCVIALIGLTLFFYEPKEEHSWDKKEQKKVI